jgi:hypothetical protein
MKAWLTIKWIKDDAGRWKIMKIYSGHLLPDPGQGYTCQLVEISKDFRLFNPDEGLKQKTIA